jgi:NIPSNAP
MTSRTVLHLALAVSALLTAGSFVLTTVIHAESKGRVFELRTYTTNEGKLDDLLARFRNHTTRIFKKHGMTNVGYWVPEEKPNTLIYIISHASREAAKANWDGFRADPEWQKVQKESEANGKIVAKVESVYMDPTDFSPMK